jgi:hypothetical protein
MCRVLRAGGLWLFLAFLSPFPIRAFPDEHYTQQGFSSHWTPQEWTCTINYAEIRDYGDRPDEEALKRLSVVWQKPELDTLGNLSTIRGQLKTTDHGQKQTKPINWFQGVTIYLAMTPNARPDWSKGMNQANTLRDAVVTSPTGSFAVHFDMRDSAHDRTRVQSFQVGLALAKHTVKNKATHEVVWNSRTPAIASSVKMLSIPAAQPLSRELELINRASRWPFAKPSGVELTRAVNALRPLGKQRALAVLEKYVALTRDFGYRSDRDVVFWIIRVLFEPIRLDDRIPSPAIGVFLDDRELPEAMKWPLNPMAVYADVPFMIGHGIAMSGVPEHPSSHIDWARHHGVIRDEPLVPTNPLAAAEAILRSRRFKALDQYSRDTATAAIRSQALAMVKGLVEPADADQGVNDDQWRSRVKAAAEGGIRWDARREEFVKGKNR